MLELIYYLSAGPGRRKKKRPNPFGNAITGIAAVVLIVVICAVSLSL